MKIADNSLVLNKALDKFNDFAKEQMRLGNTTGVARICRGEGDGERLVGKAEGDSVYRWRSEISEERNNHVRMEFFKAVSALFNGSVPREVQKAMLLKDYGAGVSFEDADSWKNINSGKPLTARRITDVIAAIESYEKSCLDEDTTYGDYDLVGRTKAEQKGRDLALQMKLDPPKDMASFLGAVLGQARSSDPDLTLQRLLAYEKVELRGNQMSDLKDMLEALKEMRPDERDKTARGNLFLDGFVKALTAELRKDEPLEEQHVGENNGAEDARQTIDIADLDREMDRFDPKGFFKGLKIDGVQEGEQGLIQTDLTSLFNMDDPGQKALAEVLDSLYVEDLNARSFVLGHELAMEKLDAFVDVQTDDKLLWAAKAAKFKDAARGMYETALKALSADDRAELMMMRYMRTEAGPRQKLDASHLQQFIWNELKSIVPIKLQGTRHGMDVLGKLKGISEDLASGDAAKAKTGEKHLKALLKECQYGWWGDDKAVAKDLDALCKLVATPPAKLKAKLQAELPKKDAAPSQTDPELYRKKVDEVMPKMKLDEDALAKLGTAYHCEKRRKVVQSHLVECFDDKKFGEVVANKDFNLKTKKDFQIEDANDYRYACEESDIDEMFKGMKGDTGFMVTQIKEEDPDAEIILGAAADNNDCYCGVPSYWGTQEETCVTYCSEDALTHVIVNYTEKYFNEVTGAYRYKYLEKGANGQDGLSGQEAWVIETDMVRGGDFLKLEKPIKINMLFGAMPSLTNDSSSYDPRGNSHYRCEHLGVEKNSPQSVHYQKFFRAFTNREKAGLQWNLEKFRLAMKALQFSKGKIELNIGGEIVKFDIDDPDIDKQMDAFVRIVDEGNYLQDNEAEINWGYEQTVMKTLTGWVSMARQRQKVPGKGYFLATGFGLSAFQNKKSEVFPMLARAIAGHSKDPATKQIMKCVFASYGCDDAEIADFKRLLKQACRDIAKETALYDEWLRTELRAENVTDDEMAEMDHDALVEKAKAVDGNILTRVEQKRVEMSRERAVFLTAIGVENAYGMSEEDLAAARDEFDRMRNALRTAGVKGASAMKFTQLEKCLNDMKAELKAADVPGVDEMNLTTLAVRAQALRLSRMRSELAAIGVPKAEALDDVQVRPRWEEVEGMRKKFADVDDVDQMSYGALKALIEGRPAEPVLDEDFEMQMVVENASMAVDEVMKGIPEIVNPNPDVEPAAKKVVMARHLANVYNKLFRMQAEGDDAVALKEAANLLVDANTRAAGARKVRQVMDEVTGRRRFDYPGDALKMGRFAKHLENRLAAL